MVLNQKSYVEERLPDYQRFEDEDNITPSESRSVYENQIQINQNINDQMLIPTSKLTSRKFVWENLSVEARIDRASKRAHIETELNDMEPILVDKAFDYYGTYVKINENQKYKYAETKLILFYKDLLEEAMMKNNTLRDQVDQLLQLNKEYDLDHKKHLHAVEKAEAKTKRCEQEMAHQKRMYEEAMKTMAKETYEDKL